jgi:hypothetical protein
VRAIDLHAASAERDRAVRRRRGRRRPRRRIDALPLADTGPLSRGTVRLDPALGLFGLQVRRAEGLLQPRRGARRSPWRSTGRS